MLGMIGGEGVKPEVPVNADTDELDLRRFCRMWRPVSVTLLAAAAATLASQDLCNSEASSLTRMAESLSDNCSITSYKPQVRTSEEASCCSLASQILRTIRSKFSRTTAFLEMSFAAIRSNKSNRAKVAATEGLSRSSFPNGSRKFSKAS